MNHHDEQLRQLMSALAQDAPLALGRKEAVMLKVSRRVQRQAAVRGVVALVVAVGLGLGALGTVQQIQNTGSDSHSGDTLVTEPSHTPTSSPTSPAEHIEPSHEPGAGAPSTGPTTAPAGGEPAPSSEPTHTGSGADTPPAVQPTEHQSPAPTPEDTSASGPLTVSASMDPATIAAGATSTAVVTARDGEGRLLAVDIDWGDGTTPFHFSPGATACPRTTHLDGRFSHTYSTPRSTPYAVHVTITSGDCAPTEKVTVETHVTVTGSEPAPSPTPTYTNGPSQPVPGGSQYSGDNAAYVYLHATGSDSDGFVRRISVDWGDGTSSTVGEWSTSSCTNAAGTTHPVATSHDGNISHHYDTSGDHTVTVRVQSVACDGSHEQSQTQQVVLHQA